MTADIPSSRSASRAAGSTKPGGHVRRALPDPRTRLLHAAELLIDEHGENYLTVESICAAAGTTERVFYSVFADRTDCLLALFDEVTDRAVTAMTVAYRGEQGWVDGVRASLYQLLSQLESQPRLARHILVDSAAGEPPLQARRARVFAELARSLEAGHPVASAGSPAPPFGADAVIGTVVAILHGRLSEDPVPRLQELVGPLMGVIVLPYLGVQAARLELLRAGTNGARPHDEDQ